jgi:hypothetical protein
MVDSGLQHAFTFLFLFGLLLHHERWSFSNGEFLKAGLQEPEQWCSRTTEEVIPPFSVIKKTKTLIVISKSPLN